MKYIRAEQLVRSIRLQRCETHLVYLPESLQELPARLCKLVFDISSQILSGSCGEVPGDGLLHRRNHAIRFPRTRSKSPLKLIFPISIQIPVKPHLLPLPTCRASDTTMHAIEGSSRARGGRIELREGVERLACRVVVEVRAEDLVEAQGDGVLRGGRGEARARYARRRG